METRAKVLEILKEVKPTRELDSVTDIIEGGYIDSFELMTLIMKLGETFGVEVPIDEIMPENFNSVDAITAMVGRISGQNA